MYIHLKFFPKQEEYQPLAAGDNVDTMHTKKDILKHHMFNFQSVACSVSWPP